jgi:hypothetical protein
VARQVATRSATTAVSRVARMVPGLAATLAGFSAWRRNDRLARAMCSVYRRAMASEAFDLDDVVLADEIAGEPAKDSVVPP